MFNGDRTPCRRASPARPDSPTSRSTRSRGEMQYSETRPAAGPLRPRLPTSTGRRSTCPSCTRPCMLGLQSLTDVSSAVRRLGRTTTGAPITCRRDRAGCSERAPCRRCTTPRTWRRSSTRSTTWPSCPGWSRCSCGPTRRSTGDIQRSGLRPDLGGRRRRPGSPSPSTRSWPPTCRAPATV